MESSDSEQNEPSILQESGSEYLPSDNNETGSLTDASEDNGRQNNNNSDTSSKRKKRPKKTTRKRVKNLSQPETRKIKRNLGEGYITKKGKIVEKKIFNNTLCMCKLKCNEKINELERKDLFEGFYKTGSFETQNAYLVGLCHQSVPKVRRPRIGTLMRQQSVKYFLQVAGSSSTTHQVCKKFFLETFQVSNGRLQRILEKARQGIEPGNDKRGKHTPVNKTSEEDLKIICNHIESFPCYQSHYTRAHNPNRKYLQTGLNLRLMYGLYEEHCQNIKCMPKSEAVYRHVFNNKFNLHFKSPRKDTCKMCDLLNMKIKSTTDLVEKLNLEKEHELHLRKAESARTAIENLKKECKANNKLYGLTFDLQKALPFPKLSVSIAYYKRNMYVYNLGVHELSSGRAFMYAWDETVGSRGTEEIISCVLQHIKQTVPKDVEHIVMFSDSCGGQNRSINTAVACMNFIQQDNVNIKTIDHKFMISGHSYLPNDSDFGPIESYAKGKPIYAPENWYDAILKAKKKKPSYQLKVMTQEEIISVKQLTDAITRRRVNDLKQPVSWLKMQWLRYTKNDPLTIFYKETLNDDQKFSEINIKSAKPGRQVQKLGSIKLNKLYNKPRPVKVQKKKDMMDLLPFIPPIYHGFFNNLKTSEEVQEEYPFEEVSDEEGD